tara:strand:+ start:2094 stop:3023 length:930 start_codon:yes stop_codon:yes gene_type:complete
MIAKCRLGRLLVMTGLASMVAACASTPDRADSPRTSARTGSAPQLVAVPHTPVVDFPDTDRIPGFGSAEDQKIGNPYVVAGRTYVPMRNDTYDVTGVSSWYGPNFHGRPTSNGEIFDQEALTAAHTTLPIPSLIEVTNLDNGRRAVLRLNDRGPFVDDRVLDVSRAAARELGFLSVGLANVRVRYLGPADAHDRAAPSRIFTAEDIIDDPIAARVLADATPPETPRPSRSSAGGMLALQAGSFAQRANAESLRRRLSGEGEAWIEEVMSGSGRLYRVLVGSWSSRSEAESARRSLSRHGVRDARVVALN